MQLQQQTGNNDTRNDKAHRFEKSIRSGVLLLLLIVVAAVVGHHLSKTTASPIVGPTLKGLNFAQRSERKTESEKR